MNSGPFAAVPVPAADRAAALRLVLSTIEPEAREGYIQQLLSERSRSAAESAASPAPESAASSTPPGLEGLWGVYREEKLIGAGWATLQPGRTAAFWPPVMSPDLSHTDESEAAAQLLLRGMVSWVERQNVQLAQALTVLPIGRDGERLRAAGFEHLTNLIYMAGECLPGNSDSPSNLEFAPVEDLHRLAAIVDRTYEATQDCPQLNGLRDTADVLAGYRGMGTSGTQLWRLVRLEGRDCGCLLLADHPTDQQWEIVYMGLKPEVRGRGLGLQLVRYALHHAALAGRERLVLAVDAANESALRIYRAAGFAPSGHWGVWIRVLGS